MGLCVLSERSQLLAIILIKALNATERSRSLTEETASKGKTMNTGSCTFFLINKTLPKMHTSVMDVKTSSQDVNSVTHVLFVSHFPLLSLNIFRASDPLLAHLSYLRSQ